MPRANPTPPSIELDLGRYELRRSGRRVKLEKKPMELLIYLVSRREQLVTREEIVARLWGSGLFIDPEPNINNVVRKLRTAIGDNLARPRFLETVVGKGYRFVGPMNVIDQRPPRTDVEHGLSRVSGPNLAHTWSERTSLAVLPLTLVGCASDDRGLCLGIADALVSRLGNLQGVDVLPTSAVLNVPSNTNSTEIAAHTGIRFVVRGAIQFFKGIWRLSLEVHDSNLKSTCFAKKWDLDLEKLSTLEDAVAKQIAAALNRPFRPAPPQRRPRYSRDPLAYEEFTRGYRLSASGDPSLLEEAARHLTSALARDPAFSLAHAELSFVCATRHFEFDPASVWLERAEFHCKRALELDPDLAEAHVARAFLLWGPSKNFQHLEAIAELKHAIHLQNNLPHAYNRLGTILAHVGLLEHASQMYQRGSAFHPKKQVSHSIVQVYIWNLEYDLARDELAAWRAESPSNKYPVYFSPVVAMMTGNWREAEKLLDEAVRLLPEDPMIISLQGVSCALTGRGDAALECLSRACAIPKSFGHSHHTYYQIACILSLLGRTQTSFEWLERSVTTGFACWPYFLKDPCLRRLHALPEFEVLISSLQSKYPDQLGIL